MDDIEAALELVEFWLPDEDAPDAHEALSTIRQALERVTKERDVAWENQDIQRQALSKMESEREDDMAHVSEMHDLLREREDALSTMTLERDGTAWLLKEADDRISELAHAYAVNDDKRIAAEDRIKKLEEQLEEFEYHTGRKPILPAQLQEAQDRIEKLEAEREGWRKLYEPVSSLVRWVNTNCPDCPYNASRLERILAQALSTPSDANCGTFHTDPGNGWTPCGWCGMRRDYVASDRETP
jgi:DNA repair exonuclease SbcCD ATPase subunit